MLETRGICLPLILPILISVCLFATAGCERKNTSASAEAEKGEATMKVATRITIQSEAFTHNQPLPKKYTADGFDVSPPLSWSDLPEGTEELAIIMDDPDAPMAEPFVHWIIYKIPAEARALPEDLPDSMKLSTPFHAIQGKNSFGSIGYRGPAPPRGHGTHHYHFKLYALDTELTLKPGADKASLLGAMKGHILAEGELIGTYER
jgi:hypothetical protein